MQMENRSKQKSLSRALQNLLLYFNLFDGKHACRGRGQVVSVAAANNYVAAVTSRGWLLRYDLSEGESPGKPFPSIFLVTVNRILVSGFAFCQIKVFKGWQYLMAQFC